MRQPVAEAEAGAALVVAVQERAGQNIGLLG